MRIMAFSDYRSQKISHLLEFIENMKPKVNIILYAGDDGVADFDSGLAHSTVHIDIYLYPSGSKSAYFDGASDGQWYTP